MILAPRAHDAEPQSHVPAAAEAALLEGLDCLRVAVTLYDLDERLIYANRHFCYLFRQFPPLSALLGRTYADLVALEAASGAVARSMYTQGVDAFIALRRAQLSAGDFAPRDIRLADGRIVEIKMRRSAKGWIALWSDATRAREAYSRLESAVEMSADAFGFWDAGGKLVLWNTGFARLHACEDDADLSGMTYLELLSDTLARGLIRLDEPEPRFIARRMRAHHAAAGAVTLQMENGQAFLVRERPTADGGRATVFTDITDRARVEAAFAEQTQTLAATQDALDRQNAFLAALTQRIDAAERTVTQTKTTFLRTMSHELKTPLNAIIGFSDLLQSSPERFGAAQVGEYAGLIHRAGGNLLKMLNQILDLTKIAAGRYPLQREAVPVSLLLELAQDKYGADAAGKSIALVCQADPGLSVDGDESALATMLLQLVHNAVSFTHNGGRVTISAWREGQAFMLSIADDGPGVAGEHLPRLTEPFEQAARDTAAHNGGAGLGLTLVKALAELHGGRLTLQSALGEGFTATIELPAA